MNQGLKKILLSGTTIFLSLTLICVPDALALKKKKRLKIGKSRSFRSSQSYSTDSSALGMQDILSDTVDVNFLDNPDDKNFDIYNSQGWRAETFWNDSEEERAAQKTWAIGASTSIMQTLRDSELRYQVIAMERSIREFMGLLSYSLKDTGSGYSIGRKGNGSELVTFSLQLSVSRGADPQISISDYCRLRYDWARTRTLLEFGLDF